MARQPIGAVWAVSFVSLLLELVRTNYLWFGSNNFAASCLVEQKTQRTSNYPARKTNKSIFVSVRLFMNKKTNLRGISMASHQGGALAEAVVHVPAHGLDASAEDARIYQ